MMGDSWMGKAQLRQFPLSLQTKYFLAKHSELKVSG